jgi:hypothetical protein
MSKKQLLLCGYLGAIALAHAFALFIGQHDFHRRRRFDAE